MNLSVNIDRLKGFFSVGYHFGYPVILFWQKSIYFEKKIKSFFLVMESFKKHVKRITNQKRITDWSQENFKHFSLE